MTVYSVKYILTGFWLTSFKGFMCPSMIATAMIQEIVTLDKVTCKMLH